MACNCLNFFFIYKGLVKNHTGLNYFVIYLFIKGVRRTVSMHFTIQPVRLTPFQKTQITK